MVIYYFLAFFGIVVVVKAMPARIEVQQNTMILSTAEISTFKPFTSFASAAYCRPSETLPWSCGGDCEVNSDFISTASGGDGTFEQFWYVGFSPSQDSVIIGHQGTDLPQLVTVAVDLSFHLRSLQSELFPGVDPSITVHEGFFDSHAQSAAAILSAAKSTLAAHNSSSITTVGHSLGAALALLDSIYLPLHIPGVRVKTIGYGLPRVGNQAFADYVDAHVSLTRINNKEDFIPALPGDFLGYRHPSGEIHIDDSGAWHVCPGRNNDSESCTAGGVGIGSVLEGIANDHRGPYDGVIIACTDGQWNRDFLLRGSLLEKIGVHLDTLVLLAFALVVIIYIYASERVCKPFSCYSFVGVV